MFVQREKVWLVKGCFWEGRMEVRGVVIESLVSRGALFLFRNAVIDRSRSLEQLQYTVAGRWQIRHCRSHGIKSLHVDSTREV